MHLLPTRIVSPMRAVATAEMKHTRRSRASRQGSFVLAIAAALAVPACTGLDIPIGPVDHSCPVENSCQHAGGR
jgi:hypothetical protein